MLCGNACLAPSNNQKAEKEASARALGAKGSMILQSLFLIPSAVSSATISLPLLSSLSFPYVARHRIGNLNISPCSFLPGLFSPCHFQQHTSCILRNLGMLSYFYKKESQSKHSALLNSKTRERFAVPPNQDRLL